MLMAFLGSILFVIVGCTPVKVQQGNLLPQQRIERLQVGMTKEQVAKIMGTSLLMTPFSDSHWDYAYTKRIGGKAIAHKHLVLDFEGDVLTHISSD
jgi:outer membrane protein assembly factor BamE